MDELFGGDMKEMMTNFWFPYYNLTGKWTAPCLFKCNQGYENINILLELLSSLGQPPMYGKMAKVEECMQALPLNMGY